MHTVQLSKHMLGGRDSWLKWHKRFAEVLSPKLEQACPTLRCSCSTLLTAKGQAADLQMLAGPSRHLSNK